MLFYTNGEKCVLLNTGEEIREFDCCQHEADTRSFFHISVCESGGGSRIPFIVMPKIQKFWLSHRLWLTNVYIPYTFTDEVSSLIAEGCAAKKFHQLLSSFMR